MEHTVIIYGKDKDKRFYIEGRVTLTEEDICKLGKQEYAKNHDLSEDKEYWGEIEKTVI